MNTFLIVRLGSLGDIVHALPAAAALRAAFPRARIDWAVDRRHREILDLVPVIDRRIVLDPAIDAGLTGVLASIAELRRGRYDVAIDLQGLLKSAVLARASGARKVLGFGARHLRERTARPFYTDTRSPAEARHVIEKNLDLVRALGITTGPPQFPLHASSSAAPARVRGMLGIDQHARFAMMNVGAAWPNKRWPPDRFCALAEIIRARHGLPSLVLWGPGEESIARHVVDSSDGAAYLAPPTTLADLVAIARQASLMVSGDTGPLHIAAAVGTPIVGLYGPTDPVRNGPWADADVTVSLYDRCVCHYKRKCKFGAMGAPGATGAKGAGATGASGAKGAGALGARGALGAGAPGALSAQGALGASGATGVCTHWCLADISVNEVADAVDRRLGR